MHIGGRRHTVPWGILDLAGKSPSDTAGMQLCGHACVDNWDLQPRLSYEKHAPRKLSGNTNQAYRSLGCNPDTLLAVLLGARTNTHHQQSNSRTSRTTSIPAFVSNYIRARIHKRLPFCTDRVASVYRPWPNALFREDALAAVWAVESSKVMVQYVAGDNEADPMGNLRR